MDMLRLDDDVEIDDSIPFQMQCLHWNGDNQFVEDTQGHNTNFNLEHIIKIYGVTTEGYSACLNVYDFMPYFYIRIDNGIKDNIKMKIMRALKEDAVQEKRISKFIANGILNCEIVERKEFYGFTNNTMFKFLKISFQNIVSMKICNRILSEGISIDKKTIIFKIYESNILPFIRFMHEKKLEAAGWISLQAGKYVVNNPQKSSCQIDIDISWEDVEFCKNKQMAPFLIASFDIECDSSHGDFPLATKNYKKLSSEIYDCYKKLVKENKHIETKDKKYFIRILIDKAFNNSVPDKQTIYNNTVGDVNMTDIIDVSKVYTINDEIPPYDIYDVVIKKCFKILERQETYKILSLDILNNLEKGIVNFNNERHIKTKVVEMIEDAFSDAVDKNTYGRIINTIYTKTNKKPNKRCIIDISSSVSKIIKVLFKKIKTIIDIDDEDIHCILDIFCRNESRPRSVVNNKVKELYEMDDDDCKIFTTHIQQSMNQMYACFNEKCPDIDDSRSTFCNRVTLVLDKYFPEIQGDRVVQIGTSVQKFGETGCFLKHIITLNGCDKIDGIEVESYDTEEEVLIAWTKFIQLLDPDIITGYNICGFDFAFMWNRAEALGIINDFSMLGREKHQTKDERGKRQTDWVRKPCSLELKKLSSSALGDNILKYISMEGRIIMDLLKIVQKDFNMVSYKLDYVAETFITDKITNINKDILHVNGIVTLSKSNYISINYGKDKKYKDKKFKIIEIDYCSGVIRIDGDIPSYLINETPKWTLAKDDVSPKDIFRLQKGSDNDRKTVAIYCVQDCVLCINLIDKLKIITNNVGMANVCCVPISFLFLRGQGIKIFSLVSKECRELGFLIPVITHDNEETDIEYNDKFEYGEDLNMPPPPNTGGYEGAIVLKPTPGIYMKPITVLDYSSLYPSSMISENLSHDSIILEDDPESHKYLGDSGEEVLEEMGYSIVDRTYDVYEWINTRIRSKGKRKIGVKTCRFVQPKDGSKAIIPNILKRLLSARKNTRKLIKFRTVTTRQHESYSGLIKTNDDSIILTDKDGNTININNKDVITTLDTYTEFEQAVFDGLQLAYKLTANSLYGQIGAQTSPIYFKDIAASTTATGRELLYLAKEKVEEKFKGSEVVYGDTDSIFINFNPENDGREGLKESINMGVAAEKYIQQFLKAPHKLEYEKTFWPFVLFSKKRYIGNKYEVKTGENDYKQTSMGIVLKRRDNAEIVKHVYGGVINILMNNTNINLSIDFLHKELKKLLNGKFSMDMLIITKSIRGYYKNPQQIAHKVLADRIGVRDPGNKPTSNDRIPYVYIETKDKPKLQGDRIETPEYIKDNNLVPDYMFYITNQIMKPVAQIYSLIVEDLDGFKFDKDYYKTKYKMLLSSKTPEKATKKIEDMKFKDTCDILFSDIIRIAENKKNKSRLITDFFKVK